MAWFGGFRGSAIEDREVLAQFMDEEAEAFAKSAVDDYTRARALDSPDELFRQPAFAALLATARAEAYPIALTMIAETIEAELAPQAFDRAAQLHGLIQVAQAAFDRRPRPDALAASTWNTARAELVRWLGSVMVRLPKSSDEIADSFAGPLLALMPLHDRLGRDNYTILRSALHLTLATIHDRFIMSVNAPALAKALAAR